MFLDCSKDSARKPDKHITKISIYLKHLEALADFIDDEALEASLRIPLRPEAMQKSHGRKGCLSRLRILHFF